MTEQNRLQTTNERIDYLDAAKGIGILMVMFGHITDVSNPVDLWFSSFKLMIFFMISGWLMCTRDTCHRYTLGQYFIKQCKTLLIPYAGFSVIAVAQVVFRAAMQGKSSGKVISTFLTKAFDSITLRGVSALWFLPAFLIAQLLFFIIMKKGRTWLKILCALVPLLIAWLAPQLLAHMEASPLWPNYPLGYNLVLTGSKALIGCWFLLAGYLCRRWFGKLINQPIGLLLGMIFLAVNFALSQMNRRVDFNNMRLGVHPVLFFVCGIAGSLGAILILAFLQHRICLGFLTYCGRHSLVLMATHGTWGFKNLIIAGWSAVYALSASADLAYYVECIGILAELLLIEFAVVTFIDRYVPWLAGHSRKRQSFK